MTRRSFLAAAFAFVTSCIGRTLGPVQTVDGQWDGIQNGYSMALIMTQTGTDVDGFVDLAGVSGFVRGELSGSFRYPDLELTIEIPNVAPIRYSGTMSTEKAVITGRLNGGGFNNLQLDVKKH